MNDSAIGTWGFQSCPDSEVVCGHFNTPEDAARAAGTTAEYEPGDTVAVCRLRPPQAPECFVFAYLLIEHIQSQDEYDCTLGRAWPDATGDQFSALTDRLRKVVGEWIDQNGLRPNWGVWDNQITMTVPGDE